MKLNQVRQVLGERGIRLTKSLGQNLLHDEHQLRRIIAAIDLSPGERVLEIGPGLGALTSRLLESGAEVWAVEMDARLVAYLREQFGDSPNLGLIQADALEFVAKDGSARRVRYEHLAEPEVADAPMKAGLRFYQAGSEQVLGELELFGPNAFPGLALLASILHEIGDQEADAP